MTLLKLNRIQPAILRRAIWMLMCSSIVALSPAVFAQTSTSKTPGNNSPKRPAPIKITTAVSGSLFGRTQPVYPPIARTARVSGTVVLEATISKTGSIEDLRVVSGPPLLQQESLTAVRTWRYKPFMVKGVLVEAKTTVNVVFTLDEDGTATVKTMASGPKVVESAPPAGDAKSTESK